MTQLMPFALPNFTSTITPPAPASDSAAPDSATAYWLLFQGDKLIVHEQESGPVLLGGDAIPVWGLQPLLTEYLGYLTAADGRITHCHAGEIEPSAPLPEGLAARGLRDLFGVLDDVALALAGRGVQIVDWARTHRYCGQCGAITESVATERVKRCPACGLSSYPRLSPAIIIAITRPTPRGREILLARNHRFPAGRYSVIAGFVEPGESLEECARREVLEEVGVHIGQIRYFGSQPWPFPNSLMIGFTAEYVRGDLVLEDAEIEDAAWFAADALPQLPPKMSIARRLIDAFVAGER